LLADEAWERDKVRTLGGSKLGEVSKQVAKKTSSHPVPWQRTSSTKAIRMMLMPHGRELSDEQQVMKMTPEKRGS